MAKYFSVEEMECKCCGQLPDDGIDERLQNVLDAMRERVGGARSIMPRSAACRTANMGTAARRMCLARMA